MAELALHLTGGECVLGGGQQVDCLEPVHKGQLAVVHYSVCRQCGLMSTFGATPAFVVAVPIVLAATALLANNARLLTLNLEIRLTGGLVRKTLSKFKQLHLSEKFQIWCKSMHLQGISQISGRLIADNQ